MVFSLFESFMILAVGLIYCTTVMSAVKVFVYGRDVKEIRNQFDEIDKGLIEITSELSSPKD